MARRKIAILGGGVASLATALELTRTPQLRERHDVTVYQMGWRLGGKCASGRSVDPARGARIEEHGLHVWMGFYENAFAMLEAIYDERAREPDDPLRTWRDAFVPRSFTPIGQAHGRGPDERWTFWPVDWPANADAPGDGRLTLTPWGAFTQLLSTLERMLGRRDAGAGNGFVERAEAALRGVLADWGRLEALGLGALLGRASTLAGQLEGGPSRHDPARHGEIAGVLRVAREGLRRARRAPSSAPRAPTSGNGGPAINVENILDLGIALAIGILNPRYGILEHGDLERIDDQDLRAWLVENGASPEIVHGGAELRAFYDLAFAYEGGRRDRPRWAAGTALRALLRILFTYKEAVLFLPTTGMGEALVAPAYQVLAARGVAFRFFRKVRRLELSPDRNLVARVRLGVQARVKDDRAYAPLFRVQNVWAWPSEPFWDQLVDGDGLRARGAAFESNWCQEPMVGEEVLELGRDFDDVVLGVSLGAFKRLNDQPTMADELYDANPRFAAMADALGLVPTLALQIWTAPSLTQLGWTQPPPAMDAGPEPLGIWADMSHQLKREAWGRDAPASLQYLCGVWATDLYAAPTTDAGVPARAYAGVRAATVGWLDDCARFVWPRAVAAGGGFDYRALFDPGGGQGAARLDAQWLRANVDPTECCVASLDGSTALRLAADESGFVNLFLAGDWTRNGINVLSVEAAVMSGMAASRALCGSPRDIVGEWFLRKPGAGAPAALPAYVPGLRHGEQCVQPPGLTKDGRLHFFPIQADPARMQALVDATFTVPSRGAVEYAVLGSNAVVMLYDSPYLTSLTQVVGYIPDRECGFCVPMLRLRPRGPKLVLWLPYLFIDSSIGMVTGREVWGFPKQIGTFTFPRPGDPARFVVEATLFPRLSQTTPGTLQPIVTIERPGVYAAPTRAPEWPRARGAVEDMVRNLTGGTGRARSHPAAGSLAVDVVSLFDPLSVTIANLKQFRDAVEPTRACYQAITESTLTFDPATFRGAGSLGDGYALTITPAQSHEIARDLGLGDGPLPVQSPFYVDIGFTAGGGSVVWLAPT
jgi:uncharacterized protein with NAD-binding domain and iron-sulfur cluster